MADRWYTAKIIGTGTWEDPIRPDLSGIVNVVGSAVARYGGDECLVMVSIADAPVDDGKAEVVGLEGAAAPVEHTADVGGDLTAVLVAEAERLGAGADWPHAWGQDVSKGA